MLLALLLLATPACTGEGTAAAATQEEYDEEAARLCVQHGPTLANAYHDTRPDSNAEEVAFYRTDLVPRVRGLVARLVDVGLPEDRREAYAEALNEALAAVNELEADAVRYLNRRQAGRIPTDEDLVVRLRRALQSADVPC